MELTTLPAGLHIKDLVRYAKLSKQATTTKRLRDRLNDKIKKAFEGISYEYGKDYFFEEGDAKVTLKFGKQMVFDAAKFEKKFPLAKYPQYYSMQVNTAAIPEDLKTDAVKAPRVTMTATHTEVVKIEEAEINVEQPIEAVA